MNTRHLGASGPAVSAMGLGCMSRSQAYGTRDDAQCPQNPEESPRWREARRANGA